jgi:putative ABC transport system permease protein
MLKNYITIAVRNLLKYKVYSFINILGLAVGIACCLFIFLFIQNEMNYDHFHVHGRQIYRLLRGSVDNGDKKGTPATSGPYAPALLNDFPSDVQEAVRVMDIGNGILVKIGEKSFMEKKCVLADSNFYSFFSFPLAVGDPKTVLKDPNSVVLSSEAAKKYFGNADPMGKILLLGGNNEPHKLPALWTNFPVILTWK